MELKKLLDLMNAVRFNDPTPPSQRLQLLIDAIVERKVAALRAGGQLSYAMKMARHERLLRQSSGSAQEDEVRAECAELLRF